MLETLVYFVLYLVVLGLVLGLLDYIIRTLPIFEPFQSVARTILVVVGCLILIVLLLQLVGVTPRMRLGGP
jgi:hypothetical protein